MSHNGLINAGQLVREKWGKEASFSAGFGSYSGTVVAGSSWGTPVQRMKMPKARMGSWEEMLHNAGTGDKVIFSKDVAENTGLKSR